MGRKQRVDYDRVAPTYDRRFDKDRPRPTASALRALTRETAAGRVLEVGCGTGYWLVGLRSAADKLYGLDYSAGMLVQANVGRERLLLAQGRAGQLPFASASFDRLRCVNAIHHFDHQRASVFEAARLLRPGGSLAIVGLDPRAHRRRWYIYDYFDGTYESDLGRFPPWRTVMDWMMSAGYGGAELRRVERIEDHKQGQEALEDPFLRKNAASQLSLPSDEDYAAGLARIRAALAAAEAAGKNLLFPVDISLQMLVGWKQAGQGPLVPQTARMPGPSRRSDGWSRG